MQAASPRKACPTKNMLGYCWANDFGRRRWKRRKPQTLVAAAFSLTTPPGFEPGQREPKYLGPPRETWKLPGFSRSSDSCGTIAEPNPSFFGIACPLPPFRTHSVSRRARPIKAPPPSHAVPLPVQKLLRPSTFDGQERQANPQVPSRPEAPALSHAGIRDGKRATARTRRCSSRSQSSPILFRWIFHQIFPLSI